MGTIADVPTRDHAMSVVRQMATPITMMVTRTVSYVASVALAKEDSAWQ